MAKARVTDVMTMTPPRAGQSLKVYAQFVIDVQTRAEGHDQTLGRMNWLTGKALNAARKTCKKKGTWTKFVNAIKTDRLSRSQIYLMRKVATIVPESNSYKYTWTEMLEKVYPSFRKDIEADCDQDQDQNHKHPINSNNRQRLPKIQKISIERLSRMLNSMMTTAQTLVSGKHIDSPLPDDNALRDALTKISATQKDLDRIKRDIQKRIDNLKTGRKWKLRKAS